MFPQVFPSCAQGFENVGMPSDICNNLQFNSAQHLVSCCGGLINNMGISLNPSNVGLRRNISTTTTTTPLPLPETFLDSSCFNVGFFSVYLFSSNVLIVLMMISLLQMIWMLHALQQILPSSNWEGDFQSLYNVVAFDQGRTTATASFPTQPFTGSYKICELSNHFFA